MIVLWDSHWYPMGVPWPVWDSHDSPVGLPLLWESHGLCGSPLGWLWDPHESPVGLSLAASGILIVCVGAPHKCHTTPIPYWGVPQVCCGSSTTCVGLHGSLMDCVEVPYDPCGSLPGPIWDCNNLSTIVQSVLWATHHTC